MAELLENVVMSVKKGTPISARYTTTTVNVDSTAIPALMAPAEDTVSAKKAETDPSKNITPRQRWEALAKIECGASPDTVASRLHISVEVLKKWHMELKGALTKLWVSQDSVPTPPKKR